MPTRSVFVPGIGELVLSKRRGNRNLKLSITPAGQVRVSLPMWAPYSAAIAFAKKRQDWILKHQDTLSVPPLKSGDHIGKAHQIFFYNLPSGAADRTRVKATSIEIWSALPFTDTGVQAKALKACEKALRQEADNLLPQKLKSLARQHGFEYKSVRVRKLTSRWGSCSSAKNITLSYFLIQLPWHLIDYVLLHELTHTEQLHHGANFWRRFEQALPAAKQYRKEIRAYKPSIVTTLSTDVA